MMKDLSGLKAVVFGGKTGMLGQALCMSLEDRKAEAVPLSSSDADLRDVDAVARALDTHEPDLIFNAAAYTQVDKAEEEPELARALNRDVPAILGELAKARNVRLVHYGTDFVFDGCKETPYTEDDPTGPVSVYGRTKLEGELALMEIGPPDLLILRTAWLFGPGKGNFVQKITSLARKRESLGVVHDQTGSPTYAPDLAAHSLDLIQANASGLFHLANSGSATWCELASEAVSATGIDCRVEPIKTTDYPTLARRPSYSVLDTSRFIKATGITPRPWLQALRDYVFKELCPMEKD